MKTELQVARELMDLIEESGFSAFMVGGCVRDSLLGLESHDIDLATDMPIEKIMGIPGAHDIGRSKDFGIATIVMEEHSFEVAQFREDGEYSDGRRPDKISSVTTLEADVKRRDFTVNALAMDKSGAVIDLVGGIDDLENGIIKTVGSPTERFSEDALRILRMVRFSCKLDFTVEFDTLKAAIALSDKVDLLAKERLKDELFKAASMGGEKFAKWIELMSSLGLLDKLSPVLGDFMRCTHPHSKEFHPEGNVREHVLACIRFSKHNDVAINISLLMHDLGKMVTFEMIDGTPTFRGHENEGAIMAKDVCEELKFSKEETEAVAFCAKNHMKFHRVKEMRKNRAFDLMRDRNFDLLTKVAEADTKCRLHAYTEGDFEKTLAFLQSLRDSMPSDKVMALRKRLNGSLVMSIAGVTEGKEIGRIKNALQDWAENDKDFEVTDQEVKNKILELKDNEH